MRHKYHYTISSNDCRINVWELEIDWDDITSETESARH